MASHFVPLLAVVDSPSLIVIGMGVVGILFGGVLLIRHKVIDSTLLIVIGMGIASILFVKAFFIRHKMVIKVRRHQLLQRLSSPDQLFAEQCEVLSEDQPMVIAIRSVIAEACKLPREKIYSDDRLADLFPMMSFAFLDDGWDTMGFLLGLMEALGPLISLRDEKLDYYVSAMCINAEGGSGLCLGEFARKIATYLHTNNQSTRG